jgi:hypothetical protein
MVRTDFPSMIYRGAGYEKGGTKTDCHCHAEKSCQDKADQENAKNIVFINPLCYFDKDKLQSDS